MLWKRQFGLDFFFTIQVFWYFFCLHFFFDLQTKMFVFWLHIIIFEATFEKHKSKEECSKAHDASSKGHQSYQGQVSFVGMFLRLHEESIIYKVNCQLALKAFSYTWQWSAERGHHLLAFADSLKMSRTHRDWLALSARCLNHFNAQVKLWKFPSLW